MKKTILITGGNTGLGYQCARSLLATEPNVHLVLACRNRASAEAAAERLRSERPGASVEVLDLDLASLKSVREFVANYSARTRPPLQAIVCNAGLQGADETRFTPDGFEQTFAVNHLGHFLLVNLLLPYLRDPARIIVVSSGTHYNPRLWQSSLFGLPAPRYLGADALARGEVPPGFAGRRANGFRYTTSKLGNLFFAYELDRRLREAGRAVTVNAFDPGLMPGTGLARENGAVVVWLWKNVLPVMRLFAGVYRVETSGRNLARLLTDPALTDITGRYFEGPKEKPSSADSYDRTKWADLWSASERFVGLKQPIPD